MRAVRRGRLNALIAGLVCAFTSTVDAATPARPTDSFVDSIGINVHAYHPDSTYVNNWQAVIDAVGDIGFRYVRDVPYRADRLNALSAQTGAKIVSIVHYPLPHNKLDLAKLPEMMELSKSLSGLAYLEGPNEYDGAAGNDPEWPATLRQWVTQMHGMAKADSILASKPIIAPSLATPSALGRFSHFRVRQRSRGRALRRLASQLKRSVRNGVTARTRQRVERWNRVPVGAHTAVR